MPLLKSINMPKKKYSDELRRQMILDHYESPKNKIENSKKLNGYSSATIASASCIDNITAHCKKSSNKITDIKFEGLGCAIATSTTDMISSMLIGKTIKESINFLTNYFKMIDGGEYDEKSIGDLIIFQNVNKQPNRIKCAKIGIEAILKAINSK
ncbi:MAG: SUF system NifU family Fe-S cluster assembly protein [Mycoplasmoidaceae bacterium]|nr:MAG: SUF system NifU family Fe-S cluster assembly protein [Mycoplasmoidaceae bacterium]